MFGKVTFPIHRRCNFDILDAALVSGDFALLLFDRTFLGNSATKRMVCMIFCLGGKGAGVLKKAVRGNTYVRVMLKEILS